MMKGFLSRVRHRLGPLHQVQILSDLHLEVGPQYHTFTFPATAPLLLLAGDIGRLLDYDAYRTFLTSQVTRYRKIFLVLGNHEFYGLSYESGLAMAQQLAADPALTDKLVLLHRTRWDDTESELTIVGCTFWSAIPADRFAVVEARVNDAKKIEGWSARKHDQLHAEEVAWLRGQVAELWETQPGHGGKTRAVLVATHHAPCVEGTSRPEHVGNPWTPAFATDLVDQSGWEGVRVWVFGHTHYSARFVRNEIKLVSNQRGYVLPGARGQIGGSKAKTDGHEFDAAMAITV